MRTLAELEVWHSRPIAPTRRVALGSSDLPTDQAPGFGGVLLAGVTATFAADLDDDLRDEVAVLADDLLRDRRIRQPRLRHRLQVDRIGLTRSTHRLVSDGELLAFDVDAAAPAAPQVLAAVYEAGRLPHGVRGPVMDLVCRGLAWYGSNGPELVRHLTGQSGAAGVLVGIVGDPRRWALGVLGAGLDEGDRKAVNRRFRELVTAAHPDHGGISDDAAERIDELSRARRILLGA